MADYSASTRTAPSVTQGTQALVLTLDGSARATSSSRTYYRMAGYDTLSSAWVTWVSPDAPDPTGARHPTAVTLSTAYVLRRFEA